VIGHCAVRSEKLTNLKLPPSPKTFVIRTRRSRKDILESETYFAKPGMPPRDVLFSPFSPTRSFRLLCMNRRHNGAPAPGSSLALRFRCLSGAKPMFLPEWKERDQRLPMRPLSRKQPLLRRNSRIRLLEQQVMQRPGRKPD